MGYKPTIYSGRTNEAVLMGRIVRVRGIAKSQRKRVTIELENPTNIEARLTPGEAKKLAADKPVNVMVEWEWMSKTKKSK